MNLTNIKIEENYAILSITNGSRQTEKIVAIEDIYTILAKEEKMDTKDLGILGSDYLHIKRIMGDGEKKVVIIESSPRIMKVTAGEEGYEDDYGDWVEGDTESYNVYVPNTLMVFKIDKNIVQNSYIYFFDYFLNEKTQLYYPRIPNVYDDSHICWGDSLSLERIESNTQLLSYYYTFFNSTFNSDLYSYHSRLENNDFEDFFNDWRMKTNDLDNEADSSKLEDMTKFLTINENITYENLILREKQWLNGGV